MGSPETVYEIRNVDGKYVCSRATMAECRRLLESFAVQWGAGPYSVRKVTTEHKFTFRPRQQPSDGQEKKA